MYGDTSGDDCASTHANNNKSTILTSLETWYKKNLEGYEDMLADVIWCNDKDPYSLGAIAYGKQNCDYGAFYRINQNKKPSLKCSNDQNGGKLSKFTVDDTTNGNGALTYKIGLLTADEIVFAGYASGTNNTNTYLYENAIGTSWFSMSPYNYDSGANVYDAFNGSLGFASTVASWGFRHSIAISTSTEATGRGTADDPYVVIIK